MAIGILNFMERNKMDQKVFFFPVKLVKTWSWRTIMDTFGQWNVSIFSLRCFALDTAACGHMMLLHRAQSKPKPASLFKDGEHGRHFYRDKNWNQTAVAGNVNTFKNVLIFPFFCLHPGQKKKGFYNQCDFVEAQSSPCIEMFTLRR